MKTGVLTITSVESTISFLRKKKEKLYLNYHVNSFLPKLHFFNKNKVMILPEIFFN